MKWNFKKQNQTKKQKIKKTTATWKHTKIRTWCLYPEAGMTCLTQSCSVALWAERSCQWAAHLQKSRLDFFRFRILQQKPVRPIVRSSLIRTKCERVVKMQSFQAELTIFPLPNEGNIISGQLFLHFVLNWCFFFAADGTSCHIKKAKKEEEKSLLNFHKSYVLMSKCSCRKIAKIAWKELRVVFSRSERKETRGGGEKKDRSTTSPPVFINEFLWWKKKGTFIIFSPLLSTPHVSNFCSIKRDESVIQRWVM